MAGIKKLRFIQIGQEGTGTKGTEVAADIIWRGLGTIEDNREKVWPEEDVGYMSGVNRQYEPKVEALLSMDEVEATFEQLPHLFEASIEHEAATKDGAGTGYIYEYNPATTAQTDIATYTIEAGDDHQEEQFTYGFVTEWSLSGSAGEAVMMSAEWVGRQVAPDTKTAGLSLVAVEEILFSKGKLYIDGTASTHGSTQVANAWLEFELNYTSGFKPVYTGDGEKYFSFEKGVGPEMELTLKLEHAANAVTEKAAWIAGTTRMIRMDFTGSTLTTTGTTYGEKKLIIDLTGKWDDFDPLDDDDGNDTVTGTFIPRYDTVCAHYATITVVNALSVLP